MSHYIFLNGSPRHRGNSYAFLSRMKEKLNIEQDICENISEDIFDESSIVIICFPLHMHSMPSGLRIIFERLLILDYKINVSKVVYVCQSGLPGKEHLENTLEQCKSYHELIFNAEGVYIGLPGGNYILSRLNMPRFGRIVDKVIDCVEYGEGTTICKSGISLAEHIIVINLYFFKERLRWRIKNGFREVKVGLYRHKT